MNCILLTKRKREEKEKFFINRKIELRVPLINLYPPPKKYIAPIKNAERDIPPIKMYPLI